MRNIRQNLFFAFEYNALCFRGQLGKVLGKVKAVTAVTAS